MTGAPEALPESACGEHRMLTPDTPASAPHSAPDPAAEISRLRRENDRLRMERDILKKRGHLLGTPEMRFRQIEDHWEIWPVRGCVSCARR